MRIDTYALVGSLLSAAAGCHDPSGLLEDGSYLVVSGETTEGVSFEGRDLVRLAGGPFCR